MKFLLNNQAINLSIVDNEGKTGLMYLVEKEWDTELNLVILLQKGDDFNFINEHGESVLSLIIKKKKKMYRKNDHKIIGDS